LMQMWTWNASARATSTAEDSAGEYLISTDVRLGVLPVTVTDHKHQFVPGLDVSQFRVYEDGHEQMLSLFQPEDTPVTVGLVLDHSESMKTRIKEAVQGADIFVRASNAQDDEFVINFGEEVRFGLPADVPFTNSPDMLHAAVSNEWLQGETALYDAIAIALKHISGAQNGKKKVLIVITDGEDNASTYRFEEILRMAELLNVQVYAVGLFDATNGYGQTAFGDSKPVLNRLARETGGRAYFPKKPGDVRNVCSQIAGDIRHQYTLGYIPKDTGRSGYRKVRVKLVGRGNLITQTRAGYFLPDKSLPTPSQ